jgi:hypothetical protein
MRWASGSNWNFRSLRSPHRRSHHESRTNPSSVERGSISSPLVPTCPACSSVTSPGDGDPMGAVAIEWAPPGWLLGAHSAQVDDKLKVRGFCSDMSKSCDRPASHSGDS